MSPTSDEPIEILDDEDQITDVIPSQPHEPELRHMMDDACWCGPVRLHVTEVREAPVGRNQVRAVPGVVTRLRLHREAAAPVESVGAFKPVEAIRLECRGLRESTLARPANPAAAAAIEANIDDLAARLAEAEAALGRVRETCDVVEAAVSGNGLVDRILRPTINAVLRDIRRALDGAR